MLGPNGAGKTTLLRILATLLRPSGGEVRALGCELPGEAWKLRGRIGFLGHEPLLYRDLSGRENLRFHARLHGLGGEAGRGADRGAARRGRRWSAAPTSASPSSRPGCASAWRSAAASCTSPSCCCSTSPTPTSTPRAASWPATLIGPGAGRTRVIVSHDPERFEARGRQGAAARGRRQGGGREPGRLAHHISARKSGDPSRPPSRRSSPRTCAPSCARCSRCRRWRSSPSPTFVIFRFGLDRTALSGSLAAGVLWATLLFAALLGVNRLFVAEREEGGFDAIRLAPIDRSVLFAAKAAALLAYLLVLELIVVPIFALFFLDSAAALPPLRAGPPARRPRPRRHRHPDLLDGGPLARPRPARPARPPAPRGAADDRRDRRQRAAARRWAVPVTTASAPGWRCSAYTI